MLTDVGGIRVGHVTHPGTATGCTVVLVPPGAVASGEVRGGAPATREFALLDPTRTVASIDAVVLCGGSAFGLAAADGVMDELEQQGVGFATTAGVVPIVVAMSIFDLPVGEPGGRPTADDGRVAVRSAAGGSFAVGAVGAGTGARMGFDRSWPGALVTSTQRCDELVVASLVVVNAAGLPISEAPVDVCSDDNGPAVPGGRDRVNTTIGVVATNARLDKVGCLRVAQGAHDGLARAVDPPHTSMDGDAFVAVATGEIDAPADTVRALTVRCVAAAIASVSDLVGRGPIGAEGAVVDASEH